MTLTELCAPVKIEFIIHDSQKVIDWGQTAWKVTLTYKNRKLTIPFYTGASIKEPTAANVLYCLISDTRSVENSNGFEDWAVSLGYDPDSRKAEKIYNDCVGSSTKVRKLLGKDFDAFAKACEDY